MDSYPFSKIQPPNTLPALREQAPSSEPETESTESSLPHTGRMTVFFVIALVSIPALAIGALVIPTSDPDAGLNSIVEVALPADDLDDVVPPTTLRTVVAPTPTEQPTNDIVFARAADELTGEPAPPSTEVLDRTPVATTETIDRTILTTWENDVADGQTTPEQTIEAEAASVAMTVESIETVTGADGQQVAVATLLNETNQKRALLAIHQTESGYAAAYLTAPLESYDDAVANHHHDVESVRYAG